MATPELNSSNGEMGEDPGAIENRLTLNPADFPVIEEWADGETYKLSELGKGVMLRQISPGEFEVVSEVATPPAEPMPGESGYRNPAVANLIRRGR